MARSEHITISKRLVTINAASTLMARVVNFLVMLWVYRFLLMRLPAEEFAVLPVVLSMMVFAPLFFSFLVGGISRYAIDAYAKGDFVEVKRLSSSVFPVLLAASVVFLIAGLLFALNIEDVLNIAPQMVIEARTMMGLLVIAYVLEMLVVPFKTAYAIRQRYVEQSILQVIRDISRAALIVWLLLALHPSVLWVVVATFLADVGLLTAFLFRSLQMVPELRLDWSLFSFAKARLLLNFGIWTTVGRLASIMFTNFATIVLNLSGTAMDVTSYHIGATFFRQIQSTVNLATLPLQPAMTAMNALDGSRRLESTVTRGGRYAIWASMLVATPLMIYADIFVELYLGGGFESAAATLVLFMAMFPFLHSTALLAQTSMATARVREFYLPAFLFPLGGLLVTIVAVSRFEVGAVGVTAVLAATVLVSQVTYFWSLQLRLVGSNFSTFSRDVLARGLLPSASAAVVLTGLRLLDSPETWFTLIGYSAIGAGTYVVVLVAFAATRVERAEVFHAMNGLLSRPAT